MKKYKKTYEDVFSSDIETNKTKLRYEQISVDGMELDNYTKIFKNFLNNFYNDLFDGCVRISWLRRKFKYYGRKTILPMNKNSQILNSAFVKYLRRDIGKDLQIITRGKFFAKLETYFDSMFPGFCDGDPFKNPEYYKFPYKNISIEYLLVVYQLDDRFDLLKYADENMLTYAKFLDYVINHVYCINDEIGRSKYQIRHNQDRNFPFYVVDIDKMKKDKRTKLVYEFDK